MTRSGFDIHEISPSHRRGLIYFHFFLVIQTLAARAAPYNEGGTDLNEALRAHHFLMDENQANPPQLQHLRDLADYLKLSAGQGNAEAQFQYSCLLRRGDGVDVDRSLAAHYVKLSADQRHAKTQCIYGYLLVTGDGFATDKSLGAQYLKLSVDQGHPGAQYIYGMALVTDDGVAIDKSLGAHYLKPSADRRDVNAQYIYGHLFINGEGIACCTLFQIGRRSGEFGCSAIDRL
jgi:TPR repeat protein